MINEATVDEIREILQKYSLDFMRVIGTNVREAQLSLPVDGNGVRIQIAVKQGTMISVPNPVIFRLNNKDLKVPVEVTKDYQEYKPQKSG